MIAALLAAWKRLAPPKFAVEVRRTPACGSDRISSDNLVYLTARYDLTQALCGERKGLTRSGGDGAIAAPRPARLMSALTTGIAIAGPAQVCVVVTDQVHLPQIVLTGYLQ